MSLLGRLFGHESPAPPSKNVIEKAKEELANATQLHKKAVAKVEEAKEQSEEAISALLTATEAVELAARELKRE